MSADCSWSNPDPLGCLGDAAGSVIGGVAGSAWDSVCKSFADAAVWMLKLFADGFVSFPNPDINSITGPYAISMWIATILAAFLVLGQVIRTAATHDGSPVAHAVVGLGKAILAILAIRYIAAAALTASDEIARGIINQSLGNEDKLKEWLAGLFQFEAATTPGGAATPMSLVLILALVGIALTVILWFELLLRNAAVLVLIATAPIAAVGSVSETTKSWWTKLCGAVVQLIALKPIIALVFAVGYGITTGAGGSSVAGDMVTILSGMLVLLLAVVAWPVIAKFFTFATVSFAGGGLAGVLGFAAGRANAGSGTAGVRPSQFAQATEARTMASSGANAAESTSMMGMRSVGTGAAASGGSAASGGAAAGGAAAGAGALGAVAAPLAVAKVGVDVAQRAVNSLSSRMEQMASHGGIEGANPYQKPAGYPQTDRPWTGSSDQSPPPSSDPDHGGSGSATPPPSTPAGVMPETRVPDHTGAGSPASPPPAPPPPPPTYTSPIEEVGR